MHLEPVGAKSYLLMLSFMFFVPLTLVAIFSFFSQKEELVNLMLSTFYILLIPAAVFVLIAWKGQSASIKNDQLHLRAAFAYNVTVPLDSIRRNDIRAAADAGIGTSLRINGVGLPRFKLGWFKLSNGRKAFAIVTDQSPMYIPTKGEYDLLVSTGRGDIAQLFDH